MRQVNNREHQCDSPVFEFSCDLETTVCTFAGDIVIGSKQRKKSGPKEDEKTLEDDAAEEEFIRTNPAMSDRAMARTLTERGLAGTRVGCAERDKGAAVRQIPYKKDNPPYPSIPHTP